MADSSNAKKLIEIDVSSDTVCPWCFVGKANLDKAIEKSKDSFDFKVRWHPYFLNPSAPKEGVKKSDFFGQRFGAAQFDQMQSRMSQIFRGLGYDYDTAGLTGNSMDCHRLLTYAAKQGYEKQHALAGELFINYHVEGKYIGDKQVLLDAAKKVGIEGAEELLNDPNKGTNEVNEELEKYSSRISGVPHFTINGMFEISGGQPPEVFQRAFKAAVQ
ncbi:DSBA-like thioredoxin domain-containing protein [Carex littledalei]|uniref:DSBA-like thioredoxin domain-containing protein n=1 Tax=Carex littledalei TaxID=544730 RepID=A0A833R557_9POAL|nr:DSBA-like thioredoxin domain-containing protein [Carex littledalei]